ncbi:hypothetical protein Ddye_009144 [Dipteronia dyeriana]|uniref:BZIP domain-containing protein n=1 Tax=Dipteronia dyeriana TaxID=168575 RepID=A0AAD9XB71_9ROSI|nr:hypothetical protein Ddye_009144 [Dipteronia dyeriana]
MTNMKRLIANRESARRSWLRQKEHTAQLEIKRELLLIKLSNMYQLRAYCENEHRRLLMENNQLRKTLAAVEFDKDKRLVMENIRLRERLASFELDKAYKDGFMDKIRFVVLYNGEWSESGGKFKCQSGKSRLILVLRKTLYESSEDIISGLINVNPNEFSIKMKYLFNSSEVLAPFEVVNDDDVQMFFCENSVVKTRTLLRVTTVPR